MVLGEPFTVDGQLYTPADTLNYDTVGYAGVDDGDGVTLAHRTLPLPSYVEVTSLTTGKTILARVERRGPMTGTHLISLSPAAAAQLGEGEGAPVRVRRVNPPEADRLELRSGRAAAARIETPKPLVEVLRRKLPATGSASLRGPVEPPPAASKALAVSPSLMMAPAAAPAPRAAREVIAYPLPPLSERAAKPSPVVVARAEPVSVAVNLARPQPGAAVSISPAWPSANAPSRRPATPGGSFIVQVGAFANPANAERVAKVLGGFVSPSGKLFRVRTGPFLDKSQAEAALANVRAAGYSDARVYTAG